VTLSQPAPLLGGDPIGIEGGDVGTVRSPWRSALSVFYANRLAVVGVAIVVAMVLLCFVGPIIDPTNQVSTNITQHLEPPGPNHLLGTDNLGYDEFGRLMVGGQVSLEIGLAVAVVSTIFGTLCGAAAGFLGGVVDAVMMRFVDALLALPGLALLLILTSIFKPTLPLLIVVLSIFTWLVPSRLVRGETLALRVREYVQAARAVGVSRGRIITRHIIRNAIGVVIVNSTFQVADAILTLAVLGYLGLGLPPPHADWGSMLSTGINYLYDGDWWLVYPTGLAITITVVAFNFIGDGLRDSLDVRLKER